MNRTSQLHEITERILTGESPADNFSACENLYQFFVEVTGVGEESAHPSDKIHSELTTGKALSPRDAARCVMDFARTTAFLRGVDAAIRELLERFPNEPIEIVYAGTGPFATLIVPLLDRYPVDRLRITLLDVHQRSLDAVDSLFRLLHLRERIASLACADVTEYRHPVPCHLIVCELIQQGLKNEPQLAATLNLAPQLRAGGVFVPAVVALDAELSSSFASFALEGAERQVLDLGPVFTLDANAIREGAAPSHDPVTIQIPTIDTAGLDLNLVMRVQVFGAHHLSGFDAGITYPLPLQNLFPLQPGERIEFSYVTGGAPRMTHRRLPDSDQNVTRAAN